VEKKIKPPRVFYSFIIMEVYFTFLVFLIFFLLVIKKKYNKIYLYLWCLVNKKLLFNNTF